MYDRMNRIPPRVNTRGFRRAADALFLGLGHTISFQDIASYVLLPDLRRLTPSPTPRLFIIQNCSAISVFTPS